MLSDLRHGLRMARRYPGVTATAVLLVALGVGANVTIFAVARTLVYQPLPFEDPGALVALWRESAQQGNRFGGSWPHLAEWRAQRGLFRGAAGYLHSSTYAGGRGIAAPGPVAEIRVTDGFFPLLGVRPARGRLFPPGDFLPETQARGVIPIVVSHQFWRERLGGAPDVLDRHVVFGTWTGAVVGVLPPGVRLFRSDVPEVFSAFRDVPDHYGDRSMTYLQVVARLRPGMGIDQARAEVAALSRRAAREHPSTDAGLSWKVESLHEHWFGSMRPVMAVLLATVGCVLLIACANLAILLLVRSTERHGEIAVRRALGAGRWRIARHVLAESVVLAAAGGAAGLLVAVWATDAFAAFSLALGLGFPEIRIDAAAAGFALLLSLGTGLLFGVAPAVDARRVDLQAVLKASSATLARGLSQRATAVLVVSEIAVSTVLLVAAGLLLTTFLRLSDVDPGFRAAHVTAVSIGQAPVAGDRGARDRLFWSRLREDVASLPGVESVAMSGSLPLASEQAPENMKVRVTLEGRVLPPPGFVEAEYQDVSPEYFRALGIPIKSGRTFAAPDADVHAVVVNESFAREAWGTREAVGRHIVGPTGRLDTIVGVAGDVRQYRLRGGPPARQVYRPLWPADVSTLRRWPSQYLVVRTRGDLPGMAAMLRAAARSADPERPVVSLRTLEEVASRSTAWDRLKTHVVGLFGSTALLLTLVGLHAVLAHVVTRRRREIAVRMALGGRPRDIRRMILRRGRALVLTGLLLGLLASAGVMRLVANQLFGVGPLDLPVFASVALLLGTGALAACYLPVRRAVRTDAITVLRGE